ncbi:hypothetical protein LXA43DRAFT_1076080 [Ganoderma leucocontextum]|nr:hypothetical protein LXA43DRAFT_1076080 [Ganoderma leucocontextum]
MSKDKGTCTCDQCFEGWLSPKMKECLEYSAELRYELAQSLLDAHDGVGEEITSVLPIDYASIDNSVQYLPSAVRDKIGPSGGAPSASGDAVYRGYVAVFKVIRDLVSEEDADADAGDRKDFPSVSVVAAKVAELRAPEDSDGAPEHVAAYLDNGGKAEYALDCVVDRAREELTPLGREYDSEKRYIDEMFAGEHKACANDQDFALVRAKLGLPADTLGVFPQEEEWRDPLSDDEE